MSTAKEMSAEATGLDSLAAERAALHAEREQIERLRRDLLTTVSHELRTPLTLIRTSIGLLLDSEVDAEMHDRLLRNIKGSADRMNALVTDLLDLARLSAHAAELQLRQVDLLDLAAAATTMMRPLIDQKRQHLRIVSPDGHADVRVLGDARRLERVLLNLLSNANKFAPEGAEIAVILQREPGADEVVVGVRDDGPGISPESQRFLFEQFYTDRTSSSSRNIGAGLGLPIARGIVEAHGGRMWVESALGRGTTLWFAVPVDAAGTPDEPGGSPRLEGEQ